jgi:exopolysaccharide biosynthesis predicted pyruvyltransferase EpsI
MLISIIKTPYKLLNYQTKKLIFNKWLKKQNLKLSFANQIVEKKISSHAEGIKLAKEVLKKIANSDYVITSRIHSALPAVAMGKKVIFINEGLDHINHSSRLSGPQSFFKSIKLKEIRMLNLDSINIDRNHKVYSKQIEETINAFLNK